MLDIEISVLSRVYIKSPITATVAGSIVDVTGDAVEMAIVVAKTDVTDGDFHSATWVAGSAAILVGPGGSPSIGTFAPDFYDVYIRITDNPETPVLFAGTIKFF